MTGREKLESLLHAKRALLRLSHSVPLFLFLLRALALPGLVTGGECGWTGMEWTGLDWTIKWADVDGRWTMDGGRWTVDDGRWTIGLRTDVGTT